MYKIIWKILTGLKKNTIKLLFFVVAEHRSLLYFLSLLSLLESKDKEDLEDCELSIDNQEISSLISSVKSEDSSLFSS